MEYLLPKKTFHNLYWIVECLLYKLVLTVQMIRFRQAHLFPPLE